MLNCFYEIFVMSIVFICFKIPIVFRYVMSVDIYSNILFFPLTIVYHFVKNTYKQNILSRKYFKKIQKYSFVNSMYLL